eukprot:CAMPEP_0198251790 /NCGR_PEP_ID=MMETSP1447-20131203/2513_1 /TAXON_ID=420782 /ORGANISM="Chaetoceros dichaeta, Strain CCMP1751" /LENGTH=132 /DNA_ID=CAMNT_0043936891 /DNA_START=56 /DNA_END=454 /DNA_ORIENTATION=+
MLHNADILLLLSICISAATSFQNNLTFGKKCCQARLQNNPYGLLESRLRTSRIGERQESDDGDQFFNLSPTKRLSVREWNGNILVDVREFYEKDGKMCPGKKGISLTLNQYKTIRDLIKDGKIDEVIADMEI